MTSLVLALATAAPLLDIRPHVYSLLGFAALLALTLVRPRLSWILPGIFFLWAIPLGVASEARAGEPQKQTLPGLRMAAAGHRAGGGGSVVVEHLSR